MNEAIAAIAIPQQADQAPPILTTAVGILLEEGQADENRVRTLLSTHLGRTLTMAMVVEPTTVAVMADNVLVAANGSDCRVGPDHDSSAIMFTSLNVAVLSSV